MPVLFKMTIHLAKRKNDEFPYEMSIADENRIGLSVAMTQADLELLASHVLELSQTEEEVARYSMMLRYVWNKEESDE